MRADYRTYKRSSPRLDAVHLFIEDELAAGHPFPSMQKISDHIGWKNANSAREALITLAYHGKLRVVRREPSGKGFRYFYELVGQ